jgi:hypothetical protein
MDTTRPVNTSSRRNATRRCIASAVAVTLVLAACGSDDDAADETADEPAGTTAATTAASTVPDSTLPTTAVPPSTTGSTVAETTPTTVATTAPTTTAAPPTTAPPPTTLDDAWAAEVTAVCNDFETEFFAIPPHDGTAAGVAAFVDRVMGLDHTAQMAAIDYPDPAPAAVDRALLLLGQSGAAVADAAELAAADDGAAADRALSLAFDHFQRATGYFATAGAMCFDAEPSRIAAADLTVHTELNSSQIVTAFNSVWLSQVLGNHVVRIDPTDGTVLATIEVGDAPLKAQPADGLLWVRTAAQYDAIDPETNTVVRTLTKADVGPKANRSWATDGAVWICDGQRLHRFDPQTLERVTTIELELDCGQVTTSGGLVIAWNYNENEGESGTSAAAIVDGSTNETLATVALPVDVGVPVVVDDDLFFPGHLGAVSVAVQRSDWTIRSTHDLGRPTGGSLTVTDGSQIFVPADGIDVLVVDASTYEVVDTIETQGANGVALLDDSLWTAASLAGVAQRFDL